MSINVQLSLYDWLHTFNFPRMNASICIDSLSCLILLISWQAKAFVQTSHLLPSTPPLPTPSPDFRLAFFTTLSDAQIFVVILFHSSFHRKYSLIVVPYKFRLFFQLMKMSGGSGSGARKRPWRYTPPLPNDSGNRSEENVRARNSLDSSTSFTVTDICVICWGIFINLRPRRTWLSLLNGVIKNLAEACSK